MVILLHGSRTVNEGRRDNVDRPNFHIFSLRPIVDVIHQTAVLLNTQLWLAFYEEFYAISLDLDLRIDKILLSESTSGQNVIEITAD